MRRPVGDGYSARRGEPRASLAARGARAARRVPACAGVCRIAARIRTEGNVETVRAGSRRTSEGCGLRYSTGNDVTVR